MRILLILVGKTTESWLSEGMEEYTQRLKHYAQLEIKVIPALKNAKNLTFDLIKSKEGEAILSLCQLGDVLGVLDEKGKKFSSRAFATFIDSHINASTKRLVFVVGGAYGFSDNVYAEAKFKLSLSDLTFSHQMVRVIFLEQLYRAHTILKGEPYHHD